MNTLDYIAKKYQLQINLRTQLVEIRNTNRESLARLFFELGFNIGAEVGVERGLYSNLLCKANPNIHLYCIDSWKAYGEYRDHVSQDKLDGIFAEAQALLKPYNVKFVRAYSMDAVKEFKDGSLDFVYIDANHEYQHVVEDICQWQKKVKVGGIVAGHDYIRRKVTHKKQEYLMHVIPAINGFMDAYNISPLFVLGTKEKKEGELRDSPRSWFYVKPEHRKVVPGYETT